MIGPEDADRWMREDRGEEVPYDETPLPVWFIILAAAVFITVVLVLQ